MDLTHDAGIRPTAVGDGHSLRIAVTELIAARAAGKTNAARRQHQAIVEGLAGIPLRVLRMMRMATVLHLEQLGSEGVSVIFHVLRHGSPDPQHRAQFEADWLQILGLAIDSAKAGKADALNHEALKAYQAA